MRLETNIFSQGRKSPECVKILFKYLESVETGMKSIKERSLAAKDWQIKGTEQLNDIKKGTIFIN